MKNRSTNFELLRIILSVFIPVYHWLLYNGVFYANDSSPTMFISIAIFAGVPFSCLYAFITMSSYFLIQKKNNWSAKKFLMLFVQVITLYIAKNIFIASITTTKCYESSYYQDFFVNGAWWYVWAYLVIMLLYPLINHFISKVSPMLLYVATAILGIIYINNGLTNETIFKNDCTTFLFIYLIMGCLTKHNKISDFYTKHKRTILIVIYVLCVLVITLSTLYFKLPSVSLGVKAEKLIIQSIHTRYNIIGLISGIVLFTLFKDINISYKPIIHRISKYTFFMFLFHETVMSVFWYYELKSAKYLLTLPTGEFFLWILLYIICCFVVAVILQNIYSILIEPLWNKLITIICKIPIIKKLEDAFLSLEITQE